MCVLIFFFSVTSTTEIYTLSLHDALPISPSVNNASITVAAGTAEPGSGLTTTYPVRRGRSEEHTSELQSRGHLVCRLLLEKKKSLLQLHNLQEIDMAEKNFSLTNILRHLV